MVGEAIPVVHIGPTQAGRSALPPWQRKTTNSEGTGTYQNTKGSVFFTVSLTPIASPTLQAFTLMHTALPVETWRTQDSVLPHLQCGKSHFQSHLQVQVTYQHSIFTPK